VKFAQGLSAKRIHQDLIAEKNFTGCYDSVKRFVRRLGITHPLPFRRMECAPGEEAQVDFGTGAPIIGPDGKRRKTYVFRIVLSHSRKGYSEATFRQTTEDFFRALENAFVHFGGVPKTLVIDNLKAAVVHPDWFDPVLTPKVQSFCQHYGTVILPTKPYTPRHKGKIEAGVKYVKNNALKARCFDTLEAQNEFLHDWETRIADTRIHGTTKRHVRTVFDTSERPALLPVPRDRFADFRESRRKVNRDGHVEVARAYYSVPPEYLARELWVRWDTRLVRIFNQRWEQIAVHARHEPGQFSTNLAHLAPEKISGVERGAKYLLDKVGCVGPQTRQWSEAMLQARGIEGTRVLQGLVALTRKHAADDLERACATALAHGCFRLRSVRELLKRNVAQQQTFEFLSEHPVIRPLEDYASVVARALRRKADASRSDETYAHSEEGFFRSGRTKASGGYDAHSPAAGLSVPTSPRTGDLLPPRSGSPSSGYSPALPDSVSPDASNVIPDAPPSRNPAWDSQFLPVPSPEEPFHE
jgi:transposase